MPSLGTMLRERYRVDRMLEIDALEAQYTGRDMEAGVAVVIRELLPQPDLDAETMGALEQSFKEHAEALMGLDHPHIVPVVDYFCCTDGNLSAPTDSVGEDGVKAYVIARVVPGHTLATMIEREGALKETRVMRWAQQILDALQYCHERGVIHRDITPENIIITPDDRAMLTGFEIIGLWKPSDPRTWTAKRVMGTPEYAPPERWGLKSYQVDARSDIYSLGATLYHAVTGEQPITAGERTSNPYRFLQVKALTPHVSPELKSVVLKAMELPRDRRYQTAEAMAIALREKRKISVNHAPPPASILPKRQPSPWGRVLGLTFATLVIILAGFLGLWLNQTLLPGRAKDPVVARTPSVAGAQQPGATRESIAAGQPELTTVEPQRDVPTGEPSDVVSGEDSGAVIELDATGTPTLPTDEFDLAPSDRVVKPPSGWQIVIDDAFETNANGWIVSEFEDDWGSMTREVVEGTYRWEIAASQAVGRWCTPELDGDGRDVGEFYVSVDAQRVSGPESAAYGLILRHVEGSYYLFSVRDDGYFQFNLWYGYAWQPLLDWTQTTVVQPGEANRLTVLVQDGEFEFYINDTFVGKAENNQLPEGEVGLSISTAATEGTAVFIFDDFELWTPP
ncbi:MAG: serine/threonine protein kinase [Anaerolineae bacterium]